MNETGHGAASLAVVRRLAAVAGDEAGGMWPMLVVEEIATVDWHSATFRGERHRIAVGLRGTVAQMVAGMKRLAEADLADGIDIAGGIVADIELKWAGFDLDIEPLGIRLHYEVLTVVD